MSSSYRHLVIATLVAGAAALVTGAGLADTFLQEVVLFGRSFVY